MGKIVVIPDVHGTDTWKRIIENEKDIKKIIFLGDYFDNMDIPNHIQIQNFYEILNLKEKYELVTLLGNHDYHYNTSCDSMYSGFQEGFYTKLNEVVEYGIMNKILIIAHYEKDLNILFTHAGVSKTWMFNNNLILDENIDKTINELFIKNRYTVGFRYGERLSRSGDDICQGPIWIRPRSLKEDKIDGFKQIVGHTRMREVTNQDDIWFCQVDNDNSYIVIENGNIIPKYI